jgi:hypothetical protein
VQLARDHDVDFLTPAEQSFQERHDSASMPIVPASGAAVRRSLGPSLHRPPSGATQAGVPCCGSID